MRAYRRRVDQLRQRVARARGRALADVVPMDLVEYVLSRSASGWNTSDGAGRQRVHARADASAASQGAVKSPGGAGAAADPYSKATFRQLKAALLAVFEEERAQARTRLDAEELDAAIARLSATTQSDYLKRGRRTSSLKAKKVSDADFAKLLSALDAKVDAADAYWANALRVFLRANRLVGLRPAEWASAQMRRPTPESAPVLVIRNAKYDAVRGNGPVRVLELDGLAPEELECIEEMLSLTEAINAGELTGQRGRGRGRKAELRDFAGFIVRIRRLLYRVTRETFPRTGRRATWPTLYSLRHQVAADAKLGSTQAEVAALLGHRSDATAGQHYGRRVSAARGLKVRASAGNVRTVLPRAKTWRPRPQ